MTATARQPRFQAGDLVSFIYNAGAKGTCLSYAPVVAAVHGRITVAAPADCVTANALGMLQMSDHPDFVNLAPMNAECARCGAAVYRNPYRGAHEGIPDVDATGSTRCGGGGSHSRND